MATRADGSGGTASARDITPAQLAATWKKSGGFDSLRKQLLADFINAPEMAKFLTDLDVSLPALLASTPSIARQERKDRPNAVIRSMKQIETLKPQIKLTEKRLREDETVAKRIDQELARSLCQLRGVPFVEEPEPKAERPAEVGGREGTAPSPVPKADESPNPAMTPEDKDSSAVASPTQTLSATTSTKPPAAPLPATQPSEPEDVDMPSVGQAESPSTSGVDSKEAITTGQAAVPAEADDDVEMKPSIPDVSEEST